MDLPHEVELTLQDHPNTCAACSAWITERTTEDEDDFERLLAEYIMRRKQS